MLHVRLQAFPFPLAIETLGGLSVTTADTILKAFVKFQPSVFYGEKIGTGGQ